MTLPTLREEHPRTKGKYDLAGFVELVKLYYMYSPTLALGQVRDGDSVVVSNGGACLDKGGYCLARFDLERRTTKGNFIASGNNFKFKGIMPEKYLLFGTWKPWMIKTGHFNWVIMFTKLYGPCIIYREFVRKLEDVEYSRIIEKNLPDPRRAARLVLGECDLDEAISEELSDFLYETEQHGIRPIMMENLVYNRRAQKKDIGLRK